MVGGVHSQSDDRTVCPDSVPSIVHTLDTIKSGVAGDGSLVPRLLRRGF